MKDKELLGLVTRASKKEHAAFVKICELKVKEVIYLCTRQLGNAQDGEDAAQEVFIRMQKNIHSLRSPEAFNVWLNRLVFTTCSNYKRNTMKHKNSLSTEEFEDVLREDTLDALPQEYIEDADYRRLVVRLVDELPEKYRVCVLMHYYQGMSYAEIARVLDIKPNAVDNNLRMARKILRLELENELGSGGEPHGTVPMLSIGPALHAIFMRSAEATVSNASIQACLKGGGVYNAFAKSGTMAGLVAKTVLKLLAVGLVVAGCTGALVALASQREITVSSTPSPAVSSYAAPAGFPQVQQPASFAAGGGGEEYIAPEQTGSNVVFGGLYLNNSDVPDKEAQNGLVGVHMELAKAGEGGATVQVVQTGTGQPGGFSFEGIPAGEYVVRVYLPAESVSLTEGVQLVAQPGKEYFLLALNGETVIAFLTDEQEVFAIPDAVLRVPAKVNGHVDITLPGGTAGDTAAYFEHILVDLYDPQGRHIATTGLTEDGSYCFENPMIGQVGEYTVRVRVVGGRYIHFPHDSSVVALYPGCGV